MRRRQQPSLPAHFILFLCLINSVLWRCDCADEKSNTAVAARTKNETSSISEAPPPALNCTHVPRRRRRLRFLRSRRQRLLSRRAYRTAVLAKLAYYDFRRDFNGTDGLGYSFALVDDPQPPHYLLSSAELGLRRGNQTVGRNVSFRRSMGGVVVRIQFSLCRGRHIFEKWKRSIVSFVLRRKAINETGSLHATHAIGGEHVTINNTTTDSGPQNTTITAMCRRSLFNKYEAGKRYQVEWTLQNWHEASLPTIKWHDTDLIIATSGASELVLSFAGTASAADQFTNVQTFEPVSHSGIFSVAGDVDSNATNSTLSGSIHRGFLNAYSRVVRGTILRLCEVTAAKVNHRGNLCKMELTRTLHERFSACLEQQQRHNARPTQQRCDDSGSDRKQNTAANVTLDEDASSDNMEVSHEANCNTTKATKWARLKRKLAVRIDSKRTRKRANQKANQLEGCQSHGEKLIDILRELVTVALQSGNSVHLTGHSQGAAIASLLALDVALNFPQVPISKLFLWTFGGPEVADSEFYASAKQKSARFEEFLNDRARYNRFVTRAANCGEDFVTNVASKSLNRRVNRRLGGVQGNIVHAAEPIYVPLMAQKSGIHGHFMENYLRGISIDCPDHPLAVIFSNEKMTRWLAKRTN